MSVRRLVLATAVVGLVAGAAVPSYAHHKGNGNGFGHQKQEDRERAETCTGDPSLVQELSLAEHGATGLYAVPAGKPRGIVAFAHGYGHTAESWRAHISRTAARDGVIAFAVNYPGEIITPASPRPSSRGWQVAEGAQATLAVTRYFDATCGSKGTNVMYGVSMGGNTSGLAVAAKQKRADGKPMFDWWFDIEGATHVTETYLAARALAVSGNATAKNAVEDIEREMGGPYEQRREVYTERSIVTRAADIKAAGIQGVFMSHGYADGLVAHNQSREMQVALRQQGVNVEFVSVVTQQNDESGTTLDGYLPVPGKPASPFAGHASEVSYTHVVGRAGFDALDALYAGKAPRCGETLLDADSRQESTVSTC